MYNYVEMLDNDLPEVKTLPTTVALIFTRNQDGAPPPYACSIRYLLNINFQGMNRLMPGYRLVTMYVCKG
jgi:hypothetical protein